MKISAVIMSRNDNHGEKLVERALMCMNTMLEVFDEIIYVDWNSERGSLLNEIKHHLPKTGKLKHIIVTPEQHKRFTNNDPDAQECCEVLGRNIGIRRATGDIIVSTNIDILPPPRKLIDFFLENLYLPNLFYTFARRELKLDISYNGVDFDRGKVLGAWHRWIKRYPFLKRAGTEKYWSIVAGCGDFQLASKEIWRTIRGFEETMIYRGVADVHTQMKAFAHGFGVLGVWDFPVLHIKHGMGTSFDIKRNEGFGTKLKLKKTKNKTTWGFINEEFFEEVF